MLLSEKDKRQKIAIVIGNLKYKKEKFFFLSRLDANTQIQNTLEYLWMCASIRGGVQAKLPSRGGWIGGWMAVSSDSGSDSSKAQSFQQGGSLNCASIRGGVQAKLPSRGGWIGGWMAVSLSLIHI